MSFTTSTGSIANNSSTFTGGTASPFAGLSVAYENILVGADYASSANATFTVTLRNLVVGRSYAVQVWVNDSRSGSTATRNEVVGSSVTLAYNVQQAGGGVGQFSIGLFMASATNQTFTMLGAGSSQINALQLRDVTGTSYALPPPSPYWGGFVNGNWDDATTNWGSGQAFNLVKTYFTNAIYTNLYFADTNILGNPVNNNLITVQAAGEFFNWVTFINNSVNYTIQNISGAIGITGSTAIIKNGNGTVTLSSANTYTGPTTVNSGVLLVNGSLGTNLVTVQSGAVLGGVGTVNGAVKLAGTISPATTNSVGTLTTGSETWNGGGTYIFGLNNATNVSGQDLLNVNGVINLQASANPFVIQLVSLQANNTPGALPGFVDYGTYNWTLATTSGGVQNFDPALFTIATNNFLNAFTGTFSLTNSGNSLVLVYTPVPLIAPILSGVPTYSAGTLALIFSGPSGQPYEVLSSPDLTLPLTNWLVLTNGVFGADAIEFDDNNATNAQNYYRVTSP